MALLLDTNVVLFGLMEPGRIPAHVRRRIEAGTTVCLVSVVSLYEIGLKTALGKLVLPDDFDLIEHLKASDVGLLPVSSRHAVRAARLPLTHRDPWDRLIVAQCLEDGHDLVSADGTLGMLGVARLW